MTVLKPALSSQTPMVRLGSLFCYCVQKDLDFSVIRAKESQGGGRRASEMEAEMLKSITCAEKMKHLCH